MCRTIMRIRFVFVLAALGAISIPRPGFTYPYQAQTHTAQTESANQQRDSDQAKQAGPTTATASPVQNGLRPKDTTAAAKPEDYAKRQSKFPIGPEWVTAIATVFYAVASLFMWLAIKRQADIAERAAKAAETSAVAAKANTDALIQAQRAQIQVRITDPIPGLIVGKVPGIRADLINTGLTPARDLLYETWLEILPGPFVDFTPRSSHIKSEYPITIYPRAPESSVVMTYLDSPLTDAALAALKSTKNLLCIRIRVMYKDAFAADRWQDFGFFAAGRLGVGYLPKYNDSN
jgi:hypothetical protein